MKARRNRIRLQKRRPRTRLESNPAPGVSWIRDRFVENVPRAPTVSLAYYENATRPTIAADQDLAELLQPRGVLYPAEVPRRSLRERFRILRWISRILRR